MVDMKDILNTSFDAIMNVKYIVIIDDVINEWSLSELNIYCSMNNSVIECIDIKLK